MGGANLAAAELVEAVWQINNEPRPLCCKINSGSNNISLRGCDSERPNHDEDGDRHERGDGDDEEPSGMVATRNNLSPPFEIVFSSPVHWRLLEVVRPWSEQMVVMGVAYVVVAANVDVVCVRDLRFIEMSARFADGNSRCTALENSIAVDGCAQLSASWKLSARAVAAP